MIGPVKLLLAGGVLAVLPVLPAVLPSQPPSSQDAPSQDAKESADPFYQKSVWNFAVLQYVDADGKTVEVAAKTITKMWLLLMANGRLRMEIVFENRDYSMLDVTNFSMIKRSNIHSPVDVPIVRSRGEGMAFPLFKE